ncbi:helix-turn-helix domain-containing protein [Marinitenerispora sediminis]|uniref:Helix-turn-helix domain-containing protein n=1 Tax=Marinitenerispora sediminis TaxID=1931232 RepID=A0A368T9T2_9ACTN|nr:helix-turn-helix domain-containing protein [Marinitenerispora sediminis]RCV51178.1 hypothetical protein DEF23_20860 [Marinitenerispora sediminis]RCV59341.1 hypothetical protein DEF24_10245 [Marinitenerispora sediminis]
MPSLLLTPDEAGRLLGCSGRTVRRYIQRGQLRAVDIRPKGSRRSKTRVRHDDLQRLIDSITRATR